MSGKTTYPTLATMMAADFDMLSAWRRFLPAPQTDVQRTVARRMEKRWRELRPPQEARAAPQRDESFSAVFADLFGGKPWLP